MAKLRDFSKFHLLEVTPNIHLFTHMVPPVQGRPKVLSSSLIFCKHSVTCGRMLSRTCALRKNEKKIIVEISFKDCFSLEDFEK